MHLHFPHQHRILVAHGNMSECMNYIICLQTLRKNSAGANGASGNAEAKARSRVSCMAILSGKIRFSDAPEWLACHFDAGGAIPHPSLNTHSNGGDKP